VQIFCDRPEALCTEVVLQDGENKVYYHYLVQVSPGTAGLPALSLLHCAAAPAAKRGALKVPGACTGGHA
jgi:hypothetical protein